MASVVSISTEQALSRVRDFARWHPSYSLRDGMKLGDGHIFANASPRQWDYIPRDVVEGVSC